ncbi:MAG: DNA alkylation repair protein [Elusimicrobia bacterium]|nr:DNA alkylation repair protein [Elusimicrobiota bacterium]
MEQYPQCLPNLKVWARSKSRWVKRAAAVTLILPARRGKFLAAVFELADILLLDQDNLKYRNFNPILDYTDFQKITQITILVAAKNLGNLRNNRCLSPRS